MKTSIVSEQRHLLMKNWRSHCLYISCKCVFRAFTHSYSQKQLLTGLFLPFSIMKAGNKIKKFLAWSWVVKDWEGTTILKVLTYHGKRTSCQNMLLRYPWRNIIRSRKYQYAIQEMQLVNRSAFFFYFCKKRLLRKSSSKINYNSTLLSCNLEEMI